jgi:hypothetical protein
VSIFVPYCGFDEVNGAIREAAIKKGALKGGAFGSHESLGKFDFQVLLSFDRLRARTTSTKSRRFIQAAANDSFRVTTMLE